MWFSLEQLECLKMIDQEGSISAAAIKLNKAKSAIHYAIRKLEEQVEFQVVDTKSYRGNLTLRGQQLLRSAKPLLDQAVRLKEDIYQIRTGVEQQIKISSTALFDMKKFNKAIDHLQKSYADTQFIFHREILSGERMLKQSIVDIGIIEKITDTQKFQYKQIDEIKMFLVISSDHPFTKLPLDQQNEAALFRFPQVVQRSTLPEDDDAGVYQDSLRWTVTDLASKRQIILDGLGWGRMPEHEVSEDLKNGSLTILERIEEPTLVPIYIASLKDKELGKVANMLWDMW